MCSCKEIASRPSRQIDQIRYMHTHIDYFVYVCVCVHMYVCIHEKISLPNELHAYIHIHTHTYTYIHIRTHSMRSKSRSRTCLELHTYMYAYIHTYIHTHTVCAQNQDHARAWVDALSSFLRAPQSQSQSAIITVKRNTPHKSPNNRLGGYLLE